MNSRVSHKLSDLLLIIIDSNIFWEFHIFICFNYVIKLPSARLFFISCAPLHIFIWIFNQQKWSTAFLMFIITRAMCCIEPWHASIRKHLLKDSIWLKRTCANTTKPLNQRHDDEEGQSSSGEGYQIQLAAKLHWRTTDRPPNRNTYKLVTRSWVNFLNVAL